MIVQKNNTKKTAFNSLINSRVIDCFGTCYFNVRYYKPPTFISRDPLMSEKPWLNPYHYCSNNPIGRVDPSGMMDDEWEYDPKAKTLTWISNKGGNTIQYINTNGNKIPIPKSTNNFIETAEEMGISVRFPKGSKPTFISTPKSVESSIHQMDICTTFEMWLDSPSENIGETIGKTAVNIGYSTINSPYSFFRGRTIGGSSINSTEKMDAFVDMVGFIVGGEIKGVRTKVESKGLSGFNEYVKKNPGILKGHSRSEVGKMYQSNKDLQNSARQADIFIQNTNAIKEVKR